MNLVVTFVVLLSCQVVFGQNDEDPVLEGCEVKSLEGETFPKHALIMWFGKSPSFQDCRNLCKEHEHCQMAQFVTGDRAVTGCYLFNDGVSSLLIEDVTVHTGAPGKTCVRDDLMYDLDHLITFKRNDTKYNFVNIGKDGCRNLCLENSNGKGFDGQSINFTQTDPVHSTQGDINFVECGGYSYVEVPWYRKCSVFALRATLQNVTEDVFKLINDGVASLPKVDFTFHSGAPGKTCVRDDLTFDLDHLLTFKRDDTKYNFVNIGKDGCRNLCLENSNGKGFDRESIDFNVRRTNINLIPKGDITFVECGGYSYVENPWYNKCTVFASGATVKPVTNVFGYKHSVNGEMC